MNMDPAILAQLAEPVARFVREHPQDDLSHLDIAGRRRYALVLADLMYLRYGRAAVDVAHTEEFTVGGVRCRLYVPHSRQGSGLHIHVHGGGFWAGTIDELVTDALCRRRADEGGVAVLAVEYRLAPENPFPAGLDDVLAVLRGIGGPELAERLDYDPENVSVGGVSAGGNLAAAAAVALGDRASGWRGLLLEVPALDLDPGQLSEGPETAEYRALLQGYLAGGTSPRDPLVSPLYAENLSHFPPTFIRTSEFDVLRVGAEQFAERLRDAGVPTSIDCVAGALHGVLLLDRVWDSADRWQARVGELLREIHGEGSAR